MANPHSIGVIKMVLFGRKLYAELLLRVLAGGGERITGKLMRNKESLQETFKNIK